MTRDDHPRHAQAFIRTCAFVLLGLPVLASHAAMARTWYVDGVYGNQWNSGAYSAPFRYFWQANSVARPGDTIYLNPTTTYPTMYVTASGSYGQPITISGSSSSNLTSVNGQGSGFGIWIGAKYVTVQNFDVVAPGIWSAIHVPDGMHHVTITHNRTHDSGGNGVDIVGDDYMTVSYNTVYGNAKNTSQNVFASGISIKGSRDIDNNTGVKIVVNGNIAYGNTNVPSCNTSYCYSRASDSDGSGIILDNNRRTYSDNVWYRGRMLVSNNVVFGNGGRGIHMYLSDHITLNGNTAYDNNQDYYEGNYRPGEITGDYVSDIAVYNNILYSNGQSGKTTGPHVPISFMYCSGTGPITITNNLGYLPQNNPASFFVGNANRVAVYVYNNLWGNPYFVSPTLNAQYANFRVQSYSQALRHGLGGTGLATDILGAVRYAPITIGAYEYPG